MISNRVSEIKREDKKAFKGFIMVMVIFLIGGAILGFLSGCFKDFLGKNIPNLLMNVLEVSTPYINIVLTLLLIIVSGIIYTKARKKYCIWKQANEDDDTIEIIEEYLSYIMFFTAVTTILGFFFFGIGYMIVPFSKENGDISFIKVICHFVGFALCELTTILIQKKVVNFEKEINPLLKGSIYDTNFNKKILDSCDESIKLGLYKSSYKAFTSVTTTCVILWLICIVGYDMWNFGIAPIVMVTIIWLVQTISYCIESIKYYKKK